MSGGAGPAAATAATALGSTAPAATSVSGSGPAARPSVADPVVAGMLARCSFPTTTAPAHDAVAVAVSGGPDSTALLALALAAGLQVTAHHVDHGLRAGGADEAAAVASLARAWGAGFVAHTVEVAEGGNLEERCRQARLGALPTGVLLGHTADDLAETVVLRLLRGTGPAGLAAMGRATHPLLGLRRADTVGLCAHLGVVAFDDPTNTDPRFRRNRVRAEVLPLLHDVAGRDVVPLLCRLADLAGEQAEVLQALAAGIDPTDARALRDLAPAVAREALRAWWRADTGGLPPPDAAALGRMMAVARGDRAGCDVAAGWRLRRTAGRLRLEGPRAVAPGTGASSRADDGRVGPRD